MFQLAGLAVDFCARSISRKRTAGEYVNGRWVEGSVTVAVIRAAHQPSSAIDLQQLPEGERTEAMRTVWTREELRTADETAQTTADVLTIEGTDWKVLRVFPRTEAGFTKALCGMLPDA